MCGGKTTATMEYKILQGDCVEQLKTMEAGSVHTCVTSPPYFGLRDYGHDGQIGLEETPEAYVAKLVEVFREVRRVLRDDGTCWLNLGDSYASNGCYINAWLEKEHNKNKKHLHVKNHERYEDRKAFRGGEYGIKAKDLIGIPWRVAFALQADGWYLRQDIIWAKPNPMPESVTDRCTKAHEYIFLLSKKPRYYYDAEAVKEPMAEVSKARMGRGVSDNHKNINGAPGQTPHSMNAPRLHGEITETPENRNRRSVWTVATQPYSGAHFATFPPDLIRPCIQAGCPKECCAKCGAPLERVVERTTATPGQNDNYVKGSGRNDHNGGGSWTDHTSTTTGFRPTCSCNAGTVPGTVLDPFGGSGTTAQVAIEEGRNAVIIELNPEYVELAHRRIRGTQMPLF
jgi:DNA modification methylase